MTCLSGCPQAILTRISSWHSRMIALPSLRWTRRFRISVIICYVMLNAPPCWIWHLKLRLCRYIFEQKWVYFLLFVCGCDRVRFIVRSTVGILFPCERNFNRLLLSEKKCNRMNGMFERILWVHYRFLFRKTFLFRQWTYFASKITCRVGHASELRSQVLG